MVKFSQITKDFKLNQVRVLKQFAFTLAETLVVIGIIGVVAALTLPNLNQSTGNKEKVVKLQKLYTNLNDAYGRAVVAYGPIHTWPKEGNQSETFAQRILEYIKVTKYCPPQNTVCWQRSDNLDLPTFITADGSTIMVWADFTCSSAGTEEYSPINDLTCGSIPVDIDGPNKGKNANGEDRFELTILKRSGIVPRGGQSDFYTQGDKIKNCFSGRWAGCTGWVIENGNMDYLKANTTGKCNNSSVTLSWSNTSCK